MKISNQKIFVLIVMYDAFSKNSFALFIENIKISIAMNMSFFKYFMNMNDSIIETFDFDITINAYSKNSLIQHSLISFLIRFSFTNYLHFLFSILILISISKFIQSISKHFHLTEIVAILILLIFAFRFLFVFLFRLSLSSFRMSFLKLQLSISMWKSNFCHFVSLIFFSRSLMMSFLLIKISTFMKKNKFVFLLILMLFALLLLLWISIRSFWSLTRSLLRKILSECHF